MGITHRFVGTAPYCQGPAKYPRDRRHRVQTPALPAPPLELGEIERLQYHDTAISASWVRKLLVQKDLPAIAPWVPEATRAYLQRLLVPRSENVTDRPQESALVTGEK